MRSEKKSIVDEMQVRLTASSFVLLADYRGLRVDQLAELRAQLRKAGAELHVVKNRLFRHLVAARNWDRLKDSLRGPSAIIIGQDAPESAKVLKRFSTDNNSLPVIKAGMMGNVYLAKADIEELTRLPSREVLLSMVVGTVAAPMSRLVGVMKQKVSTLLYVLKAVEEKKGAQRAG